MKTPSAPSQPGDKPVKVPTIMQMEALECGAASLAMILAYYGRWISLGQMREDCGVSRDGSLASNVAKAAMKHGLKVKAHRYSLEAVQKKSTFPAIIHWNFNHFVVLNGFKNGYAYINDPARGFVKVPMDEFDRSFTGVVLEFEPEKTFKQEGKPESILKFALNRLKGSETLILFVMITAGLATLGSLILPAFSRYFTDTVLARNGLVFFLLVGMALLFGFQVLANYINNVYSYKIQGKLAVVSNSMFMWRIMHMPMRFFSQRSPADLSNRQSLNDSIATTLITSVAPLLINVILLLLYLFIMIRYSLILTIVGVSTIAVNLIVAKVISDKRIDFTRTRMRDEAALGNMTVSGIEMIETIKSAGVENGYFEKWAGYLANIGATEVKEEHMERFLVTLPQLVQEICNAIILLTGVWMIMEGNFTAGMLIAFQAMLLAFMEPVNQLILSGQSIQEMKSSMERVDDVLKYQNNEIPFGEFDENESYEKLSGNIEMKDITFGYSPLAKPLIEDFNLTIHPGDKIAFVGMSGCGKSTLAKLLSGLYDPWKGEITYDGKKKEEIPHEVFSGSLLVVDQDISMFEDSISDNIKMWDNTIQDYEMIMAAKDAQIHEDIIQRPGGYEYKMSDGAKDFSGGQKQRFEITRVLAGEPTIAILDEATSALDARTEYDVIKAIQNRGITTIVIAHRLSTIRDADEIIVMDKGKVVERGTHDELYAKGGLYTKLIATE